jgi:signal transduction histidine kinase
MGRSDDRVDSKWKAWEALQDWDRRFALLVDSVLAVGLFLVSSAWFFRIGAPHPDIGFVAGLTLPLSLRRRAPFPVFLLLAAVALAQWAVTGPLVADAALLVALYTVTSDCSWMEVAVSTTVLELGVVIATVHWIPIGNHFKSAVFLTGMVFAAVLAGIVMRELRGRMEWLAERGNRLELERDQQASLAAAAERARIAREMHDVISHNLQVMVTLADAAAVAQRSNPARATEAMAEVSGTGRQALTDMRRMLGLLREDTGEAGGTTGRAGNGAHPDVAVLPPQPGLTELPALLERVGATGLRVHLERSGTRFELSEAAGLTVYRIVQEALTNALKHAVTPELVEVRLDFDDPDIAVQITDDGRPVAVGVPGGGSNSDAAGDGHGVTGMRERAAAFEGILAAAPLAHGGWQVSTTLRGCKAPARA